jgi:hypothetical protein
MNRKQSKLQRGWVKQLTIPDWDSASEGVSRREGTWQVDETTKVVTVDFYDSQHRYTLSPARDGYSCSLIPENFTVVSPENNYWGASRGVVWPDSAAGWLYFCSRFESKDGTRALFFKHDNDNAVTLEEAIGEGAEKGWQNAPHLKATNGTYRADEAGEVVVTLDGVERSYRFTAAKNGRVCVLAPGLGSLVDMTNAWFGAGQVDTASSWVDAYASAFAMVR